ncbi:MAG: alkaline phosphatase D family protein [Candidatus Hydrogenedentota bacterium]
MRKRKRWAGEWVLVCVMVLGAAPAVHGQHDEHRGAVREIARGQYGQAEERFEGVLEDPATLWRGPSGSFEPRFVLPETHFVLALLESQRGEADEALEHARQAVEEGLPFERLQAGPRDAFEALYNMEAFQEWAEQEGERLLHGPKLGHVTAEAASFWVRTAQEAEVRVEVTPKNGEGGTVEPVTGRTLASQDYTGVVRVEGLNPGTAYTYQLAIDGEEVPVDGAAFRTYPSQGTPSRFRVAFGGGAGYAPEHERMWTTIKERDPLAFLTMGDNVYIDDPEHSLTQRYCYYRRQSTPEWRDLVAGRGVYAIWDDHDFGLDDSYGGPEIDHFPWKRPVWHVFQQNWNNPAYGGGHTQPGSWFDFYIGDVHFIMLDGRYYREETARHGAEDVENPSMLGPVQRAWLKETLKDSRGVFKVVASSVPWARGTKGGPPAGLDTWDGYDEEREAIFDFLYEHDISGVVLISADRHRSDARRVSREDGYDLYDFMSSQLTNYHTHGLMEDAPGWIFGYNEKNAFALLDFDTTAEDPALTFEIVTIDDETIWDMELTLSELTD